MVSRAIMTAAVSKAIESVAMESVAVVSADLPACRLSARRLSIGDLAVDESSDMSVDSESESLLRPTDLPASIPNDCSAAIVTSRSGTHIFAIRLFIQEGKGTNNF